MDNNIRVTLTQEIPNNVNMLLQRMASDNNLPKSDILQLLMHIYMCVCLFQKHEKDTDQEALPQVTIQIKGVKGIIKYSHEKRQE